MEGIYRTPDERFENLPGWDFEPRYTEQFGMRLHYVDEGEGDPILLLHGEPTWSYLYRKLIPTLARHGRVLAPDYFGFGRSDKPVDPEWYTYDHHVESIARFASEQALQRITVVVQDWGGPIGLRLAMERPERFVRLVIMNTGLFSGRPPSEAWLRFRDMVREAGGDFQPGRLVRRSCVTELPDEVVAAYDAPFPTPESKAGPITFPELVPVTPDDPNVHAMDHVRERLEIWPKPALVLFSDSDPIFTPRVGERLAELIPGAGPAETVEGAGHFLQEDAGERIAERIARFIVENP